MIFLKNTNSKISFWGINIKILFIVIINNVIKFYLIFKLIL